MRAKENYSPDSSDWHESGIFWPHTEGRFDVIANHIEQVPKHERDKLFKEGHEHELRILEHGGKDWMIEPLCEHQPKSFAVLQEHAKDYWLGFCWWDPFRREPEVKESMLTVGLLEINGRLLQIGNSWQIYEANDESWANLPYHNALPKALSHSWLWRTGGWGIKPSIPGSPLVHRQLISGSGSANTTIERILNSFKRNSFKKGLPFILEQIPDAIVTKYNPHDGSPSQWQALRCFLDTRPEGLDGPYGDQLFIVDQHTDQTVYHIHDGDFKHIRVLHNPAEVVDAYSAHTLLRTPGRFDFMPWSEPLK